MDFTHSKNNLDILKDQVSVPFRYDYQYNNTNNLMNGEIGQISIFFNYENNSWKIVMIVQNQHQQSAVKPIFILKKDDGTFSFHGFWESISYREVKQIICQDPNWSLTNFWSDFVHRMDVLTDDMVYKISKTEFEDETKLASDGQIDRYGERNGDSGNKNPDLKIYPWYLKPTKMPINDKRFKLIKARYGYEVANWLRKKHLNLYMTSDISRWHQIIINELDQTL